MKRSTRHMGRDLRKVLKGLKAAFPEFGEDVYKDGIPFLVQDEWHLLGYGLTVILLNKDPFEPEDYSRFVVRKYIGIPIPDSKIEEILNENLPNVERRFFFDSYNQVSRWTYRYEEGLFGKLRNKGIKLYFRTFMKDKLDPDLL